jgi:hypothetical protein
VCREVIHYLAKNISLYGSPITLLQKHYTEFLRHEVSVLAQPPVDKTLRPSTSSRKTDKVTDVALQPIHVMTESTDFITSIHLERMRLHEEAAQLAQRSVEQDTIIRDLMAKLTAAEQMIEALRHAVPRGSHLDEEARNAEPSGLKAADCEADQLQIIAALELQNMELAQQCGHLESIVVMGGVADPAELEHGMMALRRDRDDLLRKNQELAAAVLERDGSLSGIESKHERLAKDNAFLKTRAEAAEKDLSAARAELELLKSQMAVAQRRLSSDDEPRGDSEGASPPQSFTT